jgi:pSer/pThr/pTyr-binding forkhead associated (FHA) protein
VSPPAAPRLVWEKHDGSRVDFELTAEVMTVGRDAAADIRVDEPLVSRAHARLERRGAEVFVLDLGSTNFTRVNGERVGERALRHGDEVRFGRARCRYLAEGGTDPVTGGV